MEHVTLSFFSLTKNFNKFCTGQNINDSKSNFVEKEKE